eukprot:gene9825-9983_t
MQHSLVAVAYAAHTVLSKSFPWRQSTDFDTLIAKQLANFSTAEKNAARDIAVPIGNKLFLDSAKDDKGAAWARWEPAPAGTPFRYQLVPNQTYALYPQLAQATPFILTVAEVDGIANNKDKKNGPVLKPPQDDYQKTYEYGSKNSKVRKQYDTDSAFFWADGANTSAISGHWLDIAREVLPADLSIADTALFYARAAAAAYDASIAAWKVKYGPGDHWRPITAFRVGYPGFKADPTWTQLLSRTPPHPEYVSGHQATVGAILEVLLRTLGGKDQVTFTIGSEGTPWLKRTYNNLTSAAVEVGDSRLYGGVHFPSANADGLALGRLVGGKVFGRINGAEGSSSSGTTTVKAVTAAKPTAARASTETATKPKGHRRHQRLLLWW